MTHQAVSQGLLLRVIAKAHALNATMHDGAQLLYGRGIHHARYYTAKLRVGQEKEIRYGNVRALTL